MNSVKLFSENELPRHRTARPLWLVAGLASILPGGGHFALGKTQEGLRLLVAATTLGLAGSAAAYLDREHLTWLLLRAGLVVYLYSVVDACLRNYELADGREARAPRPRAVALLNLLGYGLGYWQLDLRLFAAVAVAGGVALHGWLASQHLLLRVLMELGLLAAAWHAHREATLRQPRRAPAGVAERTHRRDSRPEWLLHALAGFALLHFGLLAFALHATQQLEAALRVDQTHALAVEPYYRNTDYGVQVELNAPGWTFSTVAPDEFLRARHISRDAEFSLRSGPRFLGLPSPALQAQAALAELQLSGFALGPVLEEPAHLAGLKGVRLSADGVRGNRRRKVEILAAGKGWRNYVLSYEWGSDNAKFGAAELEYLLTKLDLTGSRRPSDAGTSSAR